MGEKDDVEGGKEGGSEGKKLKSEGREEVGRKKKGGVNKRAQEQRGSGDRDVEKQCEKERKDWVKRKQGSRNGV